MMMRKKTELLKYYSEETTSSGIIDYEPCESAIESINFEPVQEVIAIQEPLIELTIKNSPINYFGANLDKEADV